MFRSLITRISVIALIVILVAGFPNYMVQEAFAGAPITFITGGSQTTATDAVRMCFGETDVDEIGVLTTITNLAN